MRRARSSALEGSKLRSERFFVAESNGPTAALYSVRASRGVEDGESVEEVANSLSFPNGAD